MLERTFVLIVTLALSNSLVAQTSRPADAAPTTRPATAEEVEVVRSVVFAETTNAAGETVELEMDVAFRRNNGDEPMPAVVYIHGGGWISGSRREGHLFLTPLARGGYFAATIDYRLADAATYPAAVHDCKAAVRFLRANAEELGIDPDRIGVWGYSAGAHLASLLATTGPEGELEGEVGTTGVDAAVACAVAVAAPSNLNGFDRRRARRSVGAFLGTDGDDYEARAAEASPITYVDAADPPILLVHGTDDNLVPVRQSRRFHRTLSDAGVAAEITILEGEGHVIGEREAYVRMATFLDEHLGGYAAEVLATMPRISDRRPRARD